MFTLISERSLIHLDICSAENPTLDMSKWSAAFGLPLRPNSINCGADAVFNFLLEFSLTLFKYD